MADWTLENCAVNITANIIPVATFVHHQALQFYPKFSVCIIVPRKFSTASIYEKHLAPWFLYIVLAYTLS